MGKDLKGKELGKNLSQRKNGKYCGRFTNRFGDRKTLYGNTLQEVKDALVKAKYENNMKLNIVDDSITLDEWYTKWMNVHKYNVIRNTSRANYENIYKKHVAPVLGKLKLNEVTHLQIKDLINNVDKSGLGFETQNSIRILLVDMYGKAQIDDLAKKNPAKGIKVTRDENEDGGKDIKVLTLEEQALFFDCCKGTFYDNLFTVAVCTGLRMGELCALTKDDIDWDKMEIKVSKTLVYAKLDDNKKKTFHIHPPKTKSSNRTIPINKQCEIALKKQIIQKEVITTKSPKKPLEGFKNLLFTTKFNTPINSQIYADAIKVIVDEINLIRDPLEELERFSSHCFRHTFATRCFESDIKPKTVQKYLGHATLAMTMNLYVSVLDDQKISEIEKLENNLNKSLTINNGIIEERYNKMLKEQKNKSKVVEFKKKKMA